MDKIQIIIYIILIVLAIALLYISVENNKTRKELVKSMNICQAYIDNDYDKIVEICSIPIINQELKIKSDRTFNISEYYNFTYPR